jgi:tetratricopeptide (TPR) repeat protein
MTTSLARTTRLPFVLLALLAATQALGQSPWAMSYQLEAEGDYAGAAEALESIFETEPDHEFAILRRGWLEYLGEAYNDSIRDYRRALEINPDSLEAALGMVLPLLAQRRWREAAATTEQVLLVAPWNYYAHIRLMVAEEGLLRWQALADHATAASARFPSDATILVYLARAEIALGNRDAAETAYRKVLERFPEHEEALAGIERLALP